MKTCRDCGYENPPRAKFCLECGYKFADETPPPDDELKLVTILFADIKGFTSMSEKLEPDEVKEILDDLFSRLQRVIEGERGRVVKYEGDCVMAAFGLDRSHDLDPVYAGYAALKMQNVLKQFSATLQRTRGFNLGMRIGLHTGRVVVGLIGGRQDIIGDAVNLAARMEQNAPVGGIMVTAQHARFLQGRFELEERQSIRVKGKQDTVGVYLVKSKTRPGRRMILGRTTSTVGRTEETARAVDRFDRCFENNHSHLFVYEGVAGIGKSRLVQEFDTYCAASLGAASSQPILISRTYFNAINRSHYHLFKNFFRQELDTFDEAGLRSYLTFHVSGPGMEQLEQYVQSISWLLGLNEGAEQRDREQGESLQETSPQYLSEVAFKGFTVLFNELVKETTVVLLVEDLHWADDGSVHLLTHLVNWVRGPLFVLGSARPQWREREWTLPRDQVTVCAIEAFDERQTRDLVETVLGGGREIEPALLDYVGQTARGNPLYIEELLMMLHESKMLHESGMLHERGRLNERVAKGPDEGRWQLSLDKRTTGTPDSINFIIQARVENLGPGTVTMLKTAAVVGKRFAVETVAGVRSPDKERSSKKPIDWLVPCVERGILVPEGGESPEALHYYSFSHDMIREVIYRKLPVRTRRAKHKKVAAWLEHWLQEDAPLPVRAKDYFEELCFHFDQGNQAAKAVEYALAAARAAYDKYRPDTARHYYSLVERYLEAEPDLLTSPEVVVYLEGYAQILDDLGQDRDCQTLLDRYLDSWGFKGTERIRLLIKKMRCFENLSDAEMWEQALKQCLKETEALSDSGPEETGLLAQIAHSQGELLTLQCKYLQALDYYREYLRLSRAAGDSFNICRAYSNIGSVYLHTADYPQALHWYRQAYDLVTSMGNKSRIATTLNSLGNVSFNQGDYPQALDYFGRGLQMFEEIGYLRGIANALINVSCCHQMMGSYGKARDGLERSLEIKQKIDDRRGSAHCQINIGVIDLKFGRFDEALEYLEQARATFIEIGDLVALANCLINIGHVHGRREQRELALACFSEALELKRDAGDQRGVAHCYQNLGHFTLSQDTRKVRLEYFQRALDIFREVGDRYGQVATLLSISNMHFNLEDEAAAREAHRQVFELAGQMSDKSLECHCLVAVGMILNGFGYSEEGRNLFLKALPLDREIENRTGEAECLLNLGLVSRRLDQSDGVCEKADVGEKGKVGEKRDSAEDYLRESLSVYRELGDILGQYRSLKYLGEIYQEWDRREEAADYYRQAYDLAESTNNAKRQAEIKDKLVSLTTAVKDT